MTLSMIHLHVVCVMDDDFVNHPQYCLIVVDDKPVYTISHIGFVAQCDVVRSSPDIVVG